LVRLGRGSENEALYPTAAALSECGYILAAARVLRGAESGSRREIAGSALDRFTDFEVEFLRRELEFGGDCSQSDVPV
jgi:hypothetical protein